MPKWKGRVRPLTKKFLDTFTEEEINFLKITLEDPNICRSCIFTDVNIVAITPSRFDVICTGGYCEKILGIYRKNTDIGCGCNELGRKDAIAHVQRIIDKWEELQ